MHNCTLQHIYNSPLLRSISVVWLIFLFVHHQLLAPETWAAAIQRLSADCSFWCRWHQWQMISSGRHLLQIFSNPGPLANYSAGICQSWSLSSSSPAVIHEGFKWYFGPILLNWRVFFVFLMAIFQDPVLRFLDHFPPFCQHTKMYQTNPLKWHLQISQYFSPYKMTTTF